MNERQKRVYEVIERVGSATVEQLVNEVFASPATIRRDIKKLEEDGLIARIWGGAMLANKAGMDKPHFLRSTIAVSAKKAIARKALTLIKEGDVIFLPMGSSVVELCKVLDVFNDLTIVTTNIEAVNILRDNSSFKIFMPAGQLHEREDLVGPLTKSTIEKFYADIFFFSCTGITADSFYATDLARLEVFESMAEHSAKTVLLMDTSKVGKKGACVGFGLDKIDHVIMEEKPSDNALIKALGSKLIY